MIKTAISREVECACKQCGRPFNAFLSSIKRGGGKFCSLNCVQKNKTQPIEFRFWRKVAVSGEQCWLWQGRINAHGYGVIDKSGGTKNGGKPLLAHRVSWELTNGEITDKLFVCHSCDVRACVNPSHLFLGSNQDNVDDMVGKCRQKRGENDANAILTARKVSQIRQDFAMGKPQTEIAAIFSVSKITVFDIVHRKTWKHID